MHVLREALGLLSARMRKIPARERPHYTPTQRFQILHLIDLAGLTREEAATLFGVAVGTLAEWAANANPETKTIGSTVKPEPPVRRYNDTVYHLAHDMAAFGFTGHGQIVRHLAHAGWRVARTSVRRYVKAARPPGPSAPVPQTPKRAVVARFVQHVWHLDLTEIPTFLGSFPHQLALLLDGASRFPLAAQLFLRKPNADDMLAFVERSFACLGTPRHLVLDKDGCFTATRFQERIEAWGLTLRFCSADNHRANSRLERFWSTLKNHVIRLNAPLALLAPEELQADIERALHYYAYCRPHAGLQGATPAEVYHGWEPQHRSTAQPPRGRRGEPPAPMPVTLHYLDGDRRLPFLCKVA